MNPRRRQDGFALLITITLLAFLVLLLVSLASLTRVETQVASNSQQLAQARQNALMALNIALGQLQQYAGPDQRATATASLGDAAVTSLSDLSKQIGFTRTDSATTGLRIPTNGTRYWTGVWGNTNDIANPTNKTNIYNANPAPVILNWLVSGNTGATPVTLNSDGGIGAPLTEAAAKITYLPDVSIPALTDSTKATDALYIGGDTTKPVALLVGSNTVNASGKDTTGAASKYVVAPLVPIQVASATIPGLAAGSTASIGRYAYWVGDEGVKAKYSLTDINKAKNNTLASDEAGFRFSAAQRNGIEILPNMTSYPVNDDIVKKAIQTNQVSLVDSSVTPVNFQQYYHDITIQSKGLLVDSLRGGMREDLTNRLTAGSSSPLTGAILPPTLAMVDSTLSPKTPNPSNLAGINWDVLADFYQNPVDNATTSVQMRAPTTTKGGISPVITKVRIGASFTVTIIGAVRTLNWIIYPVIYLGNPYDIDLEVPSGGLDVRFASANSRTGLSLTHPSGSATNTNLDFTSSNTTANKSTILGGAILRIPPGTKIPAGTVRIFSLAADPVGYTPPQVVMLGMSTGVQNPLFGLKMATGITLDATYNSTTVAGTTGNGNIAVYLLPGDSSSILTPIKNQANFNSVIQQIPSHYPYAWKFNSVTFPAATGFNTATSSSIFDYGYFYLSLRTPFSGSIYGQGPGLQIFSNGNLRSSTMGEGIILDSNGSGTSVSYEKQLYAEGNVRNTGAALYAGYAYTNNVYSNWGDLSGVQSSLMQYSIPRRFLASVSPVLSLAQLQHANLTSDEAATFANYPAAAFTPATIINTPRQPGNAIGNAYANPIVNRHLSSTYWQDSTGKKGNFYDISYLLNTKLFDSYYFSTLPQTAGGSLSNLPNSRLKLGSDAPTSMAGILTPSTSASTKPDLSSATAPSKYLSIDGAFNVNSTSVQAWAAVLGGLKGLIVSTAANQDSNVTPYPRSLRQIGKQAPPTTSVSSGPTSDTYTGFRALKDTDIYDPATNKGLAVNIVQQVKSRGPFVSLSHFVNRMLTTPPSPSTNPETPQTSLGLKGALQGAIDSVGLNTVGFTSDPYFKLATPYYPSQTGSIVASYTDTPQPASTDNFVDVNAILGSRSVGAPGWLTQADILQAIGPSLASRSDTFVVRCYGDVISPLDTSATPTPVSRAWCEAVVQRLSDYVDPTVDATTKFANIPASSQAVTFGRKFKVVSFRWLSVNDI